MSTDSVPGPGPGPGSGSGSKSGVSQCWSCRVLSGSALLLSALWVYRGARSHSYRHPAAAGARIGTVLQIIFSSGLAAWGIVVIADPVGRNSKKPSGS